MDPMHQKLLNILDEMSKDEKLADMVITYLDRGLWDEWDAGLFTHAADEFGGEEFRIAAKSAYSMASFDIAKSEVKNDAR